MNRWLVAICLVAISTVGLADERDDAWTAGAQAFQSGREHRRSGQPSREDFRRAAVSFVAVADSRHAESYLNLGNAHYLAGDLPEAIAAVNAGLVIDPSDGRLYEILAHARSQVMFPADSKLVAPAPAWQRCLFHTWLGKAAVIALIGSSIIVPGSYRLSRRRWLCVGVGFALIAAVAGAAISVRAAYCADALRRPFGVIRVDTPLRVGNSERYAAHSDAPLLPRGYEVRRLGERGGWFHVECPGGPIGWVPEGNVIRLAVP